MIVGMFFLYRVPKHLIKIRGPNQHVMKSLIEALPPVQNLNIIRNVVPEDGVFPNNALLPLLLYKEAFQISDKHDTATIKEILETNSWTDFWVDTILGEHHYHSTAHEVLVALKGTARVQFGGPNGVTLMFEQGDVVIIPAGVAHCKVDESNGFSCLGAYPDGQEYDMNFGKPGEKEIAEENIRKLPTPENDPLYGSDGPLIKNWH